MSGKKRICTADQILSITGGRLLTGHTAGVSVTGVAVDSRRVSEGTLFAALKGNRSDGHAFLREAAAAGAGALLVEEQAMTDEQKYWFRMYSTVPVIAVGDTLKGIQELARYWVSQQKNLKKIAITGSNGKSTTKEMLAAILSEVGRTVKTPGNYNSEIGLPLSVFNIDPDHEFGVFEMGINHIGEMDILVKIFPPEYGILTNIGTAHFGNFGSIEAIAREKSKIFHSGVHYGYLYEQNYWKSYLRNLRGMEFREFGRESTKGFRGAEYLGLQGWRITYEHRTFRLGHVGVHNLLNALGAVQVARDLGADPDSIARGLESLQPMSGRSRILDGDITVIEDCYNANADSALRILDYFSHLPWKGRKVVVLGSMKELGSASEQSHIDVGRNVAAAAPSAAFLFGDEMRPAYEMLKKSSTLSTLYHTKDYEKLEHAVNRYVHDRDLLLIKGSRAMAMERLLVPLGMAS